MTHPADMGALHATDTAPVRGTHAGSPAAGRVNEIDLLRFVAAMAVVFFHYAFRGFAGGDRTIMPYPLLEHVSKYGFKGVELFFMISGFVILMTASSGSLRRFTVSRIARLYPAFWACCTLTFVAIVLIGGSHFSATVPQYLANMTMLSGFVGVPSIDGVYWSLFVEIQFYAMVAALLLTGQIGRVQWFLAAWLVATVALAIHPVPALRFLLISNYAAYFIAGAACYLIWARGGSVFRYAILAACLAMTLHDSLKWLPAFESHFRTTMNPAVVIAIITSYFVVMLLIATRKTGAFARRRWLLAGALTYPLYLIHQNVGYMTFNLAYPMLDPHLVFWGTLAIVLAISYAVHSRIERPYAGKLRSACDALVETLESRGRRAWKAATRRQSRPNAGDPSPPSAGQPSPSTMRMPGSRQAISNKGTQP